MRLEFGFSFFQFAPSFSLTLPEFYLFFKNSYLNFAIFSQNVSKISRIYTRKKFIFFSISFVKKQIQGNK
jgi:hypothetical protein